MKKLALLPLFILIAFIFSCKDSDRDEDTSINSSRDYASGQSFVYDAFKLIHQAALSSKGITANNLADTTSLFGCDTLMVDTTTSPMMLTISNNGICLGNGSERIGEIIISFTGKYDALGNNITATFNNYLYNGYPISGSISYSFTGIINGYPTYSFSANKVKLTNSRGRTIEWSCNQTITITAGETTADYNDDTYMISGTASGMTFEGNDFTASITSDLTILGNCNWPSSGITTVSPENKDPRLLDFGSSCDNKATAKVYSLEYEVVFI